MSILVYLIGKLPPPMGGVTVHTQRLGAWLSMIENVEVRHISTKFSFIKFAFEMLGSKSRATVVHCQISSEYGLIIVGLIVLLSRRRAKFVYSIHSEYWIADRISKRFYVSFLIRYFLRKLSFLIADNINIKRAASEFCDHVHVLSPFLPPVGALVKCELSSYLGLKSFDSPVLVFNAYKLVYRSDGKDVYGLDVMLAAFEKIDFPVTLVLLIPELNLGDKDIIDAFIQNMRAGVNKERIHIVVRPDLEGWQVIAKSDVFIRPTITDGDALSVRESLYYGVPTVVSDCTVRPLGVITFKTGDADDLAEKIKIAIRRGKENSTIDTTRNPARNFFLLYSNLF